MRELNYISKDPMDFVNFKLLEAVKGEPRALKRVKVHSKTS